MMRFALPALLLMIGAPACSGWGESADPASPEAQTIQNVLKVPGGARLEHVGDAVSDGSLLHVSVTTEADANGIKQRLLRKPGEGAWEMLGSSTTSSEPRLLARDESVYWVSNEAEGAKVRHSSSSGGTKELCTLDSGDPAGIGQTGRYLYVMQSRPDATCKYSSADETFCPGPTSASIQACPTDDTDAGATGARQILGNIQLLSNQMIHGLLVEGATLYWFEAEPGNGGDNGARLMKLPVDHLGDGAATAQEPSVVLPLGPDHYPLGFAHFAQYGWVVVSSMNVDPDGPSFSGCVVWRLPNDSTEYVALRRDPSHTCAGMSVDPTAIWLTTSWFDAQSHAGVVRVSPDMPLGNTAPALPPAFEIVRPNLGLRETLRFKESVLLGSHAGLLSVPMGIVP